MIVCTAVSTPLSSCRQPATCNLQVFKNFKEHRSFRPPFAATGIHGGALLGVRSAECITFYDWETGALVRRIDEAPKVGGV